MNDKKHQIFKDMQKGRKKAKMLKKRFLKEKNKNKRDSIASKENRSDTKKITLIGTNLFSKALESKSKESKSKTENKNLSKIRLSENASKEGSNTKTPEKTRSLKLKLFPKNNAKKDNLERKSTNQIVFEAPKEGKPKSSQDSHSKSESEMLKQRKWKLMIDDVKIENLTTENVDCFLVIKVERIKSNSRILLVPKNVESIPEQLKEDDASQIKSNSKIVLACEVSELKADLKKNSVDHLDMVLKKNFWLSYSDLFSTIILFQVWTHSPWSVNKLLGEARVDLHGLASGSIKREFSLYCETSNGKKQTTKVNMRILLQEEWEYIMSFRDFGVTNVVNNKGKLIDCRLKLKLPKGRLRYRELASEVVRKKKNPKWNSIQGTLNFKGTLDSLEDQDIALQILDFGNFRDSVLAEEHISLKGILDSQTLQIPLKFFVKEKLR